MDRVRQEEGERHAKAVKTQLEAALGDGSKYHQPHYQSNIRCAPISKKPRSLVWKGSKLCPLSNSGYSQAHLGHLKDQPHTGSLYLLAQPGPQESGSGLRYQKTHHQLLVQQIIKLHPCSSLCSRGTRTAQPSPKQTRNRD